MFDYCRSAPYFYLAIIAVLLGFSGLLVGFDPGNCPTGGYDTFWASDVMTHPLHFLHLGHLTATLVLLSLRGQQRRLFTLLALEGLALLAGLCVADGPSYDVLMLPGYHWTIFLAIVSFPLLVWLAIQPLVFPLRTRVKAVSLALVIISASLSYAVVTDAISWKTYQRKGCTDWQCSSFRGSVPNGGDQIVF